MAITQKQKVEKHSYLKKVYNKVEEKIEFKKDIEKVIIKSEEAAFDKKGFIQNVVLAGILGLLATSGYILAKVF